MQRSDSITTSKDRDRPWKACIAPFRILSFRGTVFNCKQLLKYEIKYITVLLDPESTRRRVYLSQSHNVNAFSTHE